MAKAGDHRSSTRLVARQVAEMQLARGTRWQVLAGHDWLDSIVFGTIMTASLAHLPLREPATGRWFGIEDAAALARPVTATAIAQSMQLPHTTIRRRTARLTVAGLLVQRTGGLAPTPEFVADQAMAAVIAANAHDLARMLTALGDAGYRPAIDAVAVGVPALPPGVTERALLAFSMRTLEQMTQLYGDMISATIVSAILAANISHITADPALARCYAGDDRPPGDDQRRPIALRALARALDMPFETVRRRVVAIAAAGWVAASDGGVVVPTAVVVGDRFVENNRRIIAHFESMLDQLGALAVQPRR